MRQKYNFIAFMAIVSKKKRQSIPVYCLE